MPPLFDVPGWSVPTAAPVSAKRQSESKKRKRTAEEQELLRAAQANIDKLIGSLGDDTQAQAGGASSKKRRKTKHDAQSSRRDQRAKAQHVQTPPSTEARTKSAKKKQKRGGIQPEDAGLTSLQQSLKKNLDGARFRVLNETLYKSSSTEAVEMMKQDPKVFEDYHVGFRRQVESWPSNPVSYYISELSSYPAKTVVADLGCGDAALARALVANDMVVLSFDLVSDGVYVIEADICSHLPLPGSEPRSAEPTRGEAQVVDVAVCALSLMSTNWPKCISEAWRILRPGGELMIAEVTSRFASVDKFISLISSIGFKLQKKDDRNSHFMLFKFKKVARGFISEQEWSTHMAGGRVLKSCEYKRR